MNKSEIGPTARHQQPILAGVYVFAAWFALIVGILAAILAAIGGALVAGICLVFSSLFVMLVLLGVAQFISFVGAIAHHTEQISLQVQSNFFHIRKAMERIESTLSVASEEATDQQSE